STRDERVQVAKVHDIEPLRAEQLAGTCGASVVASAHELIESVDAVYITTPNTKHTELAVAATVAGKHVFCEKPMATDTADARCLMEAAHASRAVFQVGHNRRFAPVYA